MARVPPAIARKPASMDTTAKRVSTRTTHIRVTRRTKRAWMTLKLAVARAWCPAAMVEQLQRWKGSYPCMIGRTRRCASKRLRTADGVRVKLYLIFTLWAMRSGLPRGLRYGLNKIRRKDRRLSILLGTVFLEQNINRLTSRIVIHQQILHLMQQWYCSRRWAYIDPST